jgi:hypothetical protein
MPTWTVTQCTFVPTLTDKATRTITVPRSLDTQQLADVLIADHQARSTKDRPITDYRVENFGDEIAIYVRSGNRDRKILNLQYEG